jgi:hypothetical protein
MLASIPGVGAALFEPFSATAFRRRLPRLSHSEVLPAEESHLTLSQLYSIVWMFHLPFPGPTSPECHCIRHSFKAFCNYESIFDL